MSGSDITTQAIRLAMGMSQLRADAASQNIARAGTPGQQAVRVDFGRAQGLLEAAAGAFAGKDASLVNALADAAANSASGTHLQDAGRAIQLDEEVADMSSATLKYTALTESLNRHFGLMRLAVTGRN